MAAMGRASSWSPAHCPRGSIRRPRGPSPGSSWHASAWLCPGLWLPAHTGSVSRPSCAALGGARLCSSSSAHRPLKALGQPGHVRLLPPAGMPPLGCPRLSPAAREPRGAARVGLAGGSPWLRVPACAQGDPAPSPTLRKVTACAAPAGMHPACVWGRLFSLADELQCRFSHARPRSARWQLHFCPQGAGTAACGTLHLLPSALLPSAPACPSSAGSGSSCHCCHSTPKGPCAFKDVFVLPGQCGCWSKSLPQQPGSTSGWGRMPRAGPSPTRQMGSYLCHSPEVWLSSTGSSAGALGMPPALWGLLAAPLTHRRQPEWRRACWTSLTSCGTWVQPRGKGIPTSQS